jgi:glycerate 2-kinase
VRVLAAVDKFKGTASGVQVAGAVGAACWEAGHDCVELPMADGGEGTLDALGGANRTSTVTGPLGDPVRAEWRLYRGTAVIEMARASGLTLVGGPANNDPMAASTIGTGELIDMALDAGAKKIIVCLGGSATTDGGYGAVRAIHAPHRLRGVQLLVACDVRTRFLDAAEVFGPQKGATPAQVKLLTNRLQRLAQIYQHDYGVDVREIDGTGAAGGIAGALVALGGKLLPGFELVADELDLHDAIAAADVVVTGEGYLDETSFDGKVVGGVQSWAQAAGKPVGAVVGGAEPDVAARIDHVSLVDCYGEERARREPLWCIEHATAALLPRLTERR